jgi:hypothetical protein
MEDRVVFFIGALVGGLVASGWYIIYQHWKSSKNLRSSSEKADKEALEKRQKAREDRRNRTDSAWAGHHRGLCDDIELAQLKRSTHVEEAVDRAGCLCGLSVQAPAGDVSAGRAPTGRAFPGN